MLFCKTFFRLVHKKVTTIKKWLALNITLISLFSNAYQKFHPVKHNFFPTLTHNWLTIIAVYIFHQLKKKYKKWGDWLALKVYIRFKIEPFYPIWNRYHENLTFRIFFECSKVITTYRDKRNPVFTFNMIFVIFRKFLLSKISGFCLWLQWIAVFFYFSIILKHTEWQRLSQWGHKKGTLNTYFHFVFCKICFLKWLFWNRPVKNSSFV